MRFSLGSAIFAVIQATIAPGGNAFSPSAALSRLTVRSRWLSMVGGGGYDNSDYLNNLDGDEDDMARGNEQYDEFRQRREAFLEKQAELMKTEQGRKFLEMRQKLADKEAAELGGEAQTWAPGVGGEMFDGQDGGFGDLVGGDAMSSGGGSRMRNMMSRAGSERAPSPGLRNFGLVGMDEDGEGEDDQGDVERAE